MLEKCIQYTYAAATTIKGIEFVSALYKKVEEKSTSSTFGFRA
ncbi:hypothetical protein RV13_GL000825 [Enterococcus raffinosus]|nr:hypothetical protein [Enterococcus raffinosus]OJG85754.1 hypothetical protein RV13_GL000825 [Enterococcus raffinosus]